MNDVVIEFDRKEPPAGRVISPAGVVPFEGWLALLRLLETAACSDAPT
jgi:hypothetical protein